MIETFNNTVLTLGLIIWCWSLYILLFNRGVPNIPTAPKIRAKAVDLLKTHMEERTDKSAPFQIVDLGSGDGKISWEIAKALPSAQVTGFEISRLALWKSRLRAKLTDMENLEYKRADFFEEDLSEVDAIYMFMRPPFMKVLSPKLKKELKKGTLIVSNKFPLYEDWKPREVFEIKSLYLHQKTLYVYEASTGTKS